MRPGGRTLNVFMQRGSMSHVHFGNFGALTADIDAGGEVAAAHSHALKIVVFNGGIAVVNSNGVDFGLTIGVLNIDYIDAT